MKRIFPALALLVGGYWVYESLQLGLWDGKKMGPGFFPFVAGALAVVLALAVLLSKDNGSNVLFDKKIFIPVIVMLAVVACTYVLGIIPAIGLYIFLWLFLYEKAGIRQSVIASVITATVMYFIFVFWLKVRFPHPIITKFF